MTERRTGSLKELQEIDLQLEELRGRVAEFDPLLAEVEEPALALEKEVATLKGRLQEMKVEERRLEHSADDRRARSKKLQERLKAVRNLREEAAVRAEMDLLRMALEGDEQEALTLLDQIRKMEDRLDGGGESPRRGPGLCGAQEAPSSWRNRRMAWTEFAVLKEKRKIFASQVPSRDLHNYERIRGGGRTVAVAPLTPDGACGHCFGMIPLQVQNEIRKGA